MRRPSLLSTAVSALAALSFGSSVALAQDWGSSDLPDLGDAFRRVLQHFDDNGPLQFYVPSANLTNARQGDQYSYNVGGLVKGQDGKDVTFSKDPSSSGSDWISISPSGVLSGTPTADSHDTTIQITASSGSETTRANLTIPVRPAGYTLTDTLKIMSFNLWFSGLEVDDFAEKQLRFILNSGADIVGFQEDFMGFSGPTLAKRLGWYHWTTRFSITIISRYPISEAYGGFANKDANLLVQALSGEIVGTSAGVRIAVDKAKGLEVNMFDLHLTSFPYGPDAFCFDKNTTENVMLGEETRVSEVNTTLQSIGSYLSNADSVPVFLAGDFNAPSHLDWTAETADKHCGVGAFRWPTSYMLTEAGLQDPFRTVHPDPVKEPGITFSPVDVMDHERNVTNPMDRIDFLYHKGSKVEVVDAEMLGVGEPKQKPDHGSNELPSDHLAVLVTYKITW